VSDTPETDAVVERSEALVEPYEALRGHACDLERERDALKRQKDAEIASLRSRLSGGGGQTIEDLREVAAALSGALQLASRENEQKRAQIAWLKSRLYGDGDLDVADCAVTVEECRGVIRRMERRIEELRGALGGLVGGVEEADLERMVWKVKKGEAVWVCGPTALAAVEALRREGKRHV
jgi:hypothetical protein